MSEAKTPTPTKEKKSSDKDLDLSNASRGVWLVKIPKYMADRWETIDTPATVGKLTISRKPGQKPVVSFSLDDEIAAGSPEEEEKSPADKSSKDKTPSDKTPNDKPPKKDKLPKEHKFNVTTVMGHSLAVFSHLAGDPEASTPVPDKLCLEGKVVQRAECRPIQDSTYMKMKHKSFIAAGQPTRTTVQLNTVVNAYKPVANHAGNIAHEKLKKIEGKKSRDDKERVLETLFGLFEKHQYYNIKDLAKGTKQPITYLKEILNEVCHYNVKNPHKNMWELKPEYRHYKAKPEEETKNDGDDSSDDD